MGDRTRELRDALGDMLGRIAPPSPVRSTHTAGWIAGLAGLAAAVGICLAVVWMYDRRLGQLVDHAMAEKRRRPVRESVRDGALGRLPSDEAAIRAAAEVPTNGVPEPVERHRAATETAGGSL